MKRASMACALALLCVLPAPAALAGDGAPKAFGEGSWQELLAAHRGRPLIVHFWSIACAPCLTELPAWGKFLAEHPAAPLVIVHWGERPEPADRISKALAEAGLAGAENWTLAGGFEQKIRFGIDRDWMGELPRTELIAGDGGVTAMSGAVDFAKLSAWLDGAKTR